MKNFISLVVVMLISLSASNLKAWSPWSISQVRENSRFLTDKMAYELNFTPRQYNDVYEVNYDFFCAVRFKLALIAQGYDEYYDVYYEALDLRSEDLRWILSDSQFRRFVNIEYFYRPIYRYSDSYYLRVSQAYPHGMFYFDFPHTLRVYAGEHHHGNYAKESYYHGRYDHRTYSRPVTARAEENYSRNRTSDFSNNSHPQYTRHDRNSANNRYNDGPSKGRNAYKENQKSPQESYRNSRTSDHSTNQSTQRPPVQNSHNNQGTQGAQSTQNQNPNNGGRTSRSTSTLGNGATPTNVSPYTSRKYTYDDAKTKRKEGMNVNIPTRSASVKDNSSNGRTNKTSTDNSRSGRSRSR